MQNQLNLLTLMQIHRKLPNRCLLKFELQILLREYFHKNVMVQFGFAGRSAFAFFDYERLIPQSSLVKIFQYHIFGHTFPKTLSNSHLLKPVCPFTPISDDSTWETEVYNLSPIKKLSAS